MTPVRLVGDLKLALGEGATWDWRSATLWFVDIEGGRVHCHRPADGAFFSFDVGGTPSFVALAAGGGLVVGNGAELGRFEAETMSDPIARLDLPVGARLNDGCVDLQGRLWLGAMHFASTQGVHRLTTDGVVATEARCRVPNGPAFSTDGNLLYHVDTLAGRIDRFNLRDDLDLRNPEPLILIDPADGKPDGITIDAEGHLWLCIWGAGEVRRHAPDGTLVATVHLPVSQVTRLAFGGDDLKRAFVTTARRGLDATALERQPLAGGLFAFDVDAPGVRAAIVTELPA